MLVAFRKYFVPLPLEKESFARGLARTPKMLKMGNKFKGKDIFVLDEDGSLFINLENLEELKNELCKKLNSTYMTDYFKQYQKLVKKFKKESIEMGKNSSKKKVGGLINDLKRWFGYHEEYISFPTSTKVLPEILEYKIKADLASYSKGKLDLLLTVNKSWSLQLAVDSLQCYIDFKKGVKGSLEKFCRKYAGLKLGDFKMPRYNNPIAVKNMLISAYSYMSPSEVKRALRKIEKRIQKREKNQKEMFRNIPKNTKTLVRHYWSIQKTLDYEVPVLAWNCYYGLIPLVRNLSKELVGMGLLDNPEDVFMIKQSELALSKIKKLGNEIVKRRQRYLELSEKNGTKNADLLLKRDMT